MSMKYALITSTALTAFALPAQADISPDEVWSMMQTYYANAGVTVTAQSNKNGDDLILRDVLLTLPSDTGDIVLTIPEIRLERDGGGVALGLSETMTAKIPHTSDMGEVGEATLTMTQTDLEAAISGDAGDMTVDFDVPGFTAEVSGTVVDGDTLPMVIRLAIKDLAGTEHVKTGADTSVESDFTIGSLIYTATGAGPEGQGTMNMRGEIKDTVTKLKMHTPEGAAMANLSEALAKGFTMEGNVKFGASEGGGEVTSPSGTMTTATTGQSGTLDFALGKSGARYDATTVAVTVDQTSPMMPFPIHLEFASGAAGVEMPMVPGEDASPVGLELRLEELTVNDEIWALFDPSAQLPRTPATVILNLDGMAKLTGDLTNPTDLQTGQLPFELENMSLTELKIMLLGADLTGTGAMTMNNSGPVPVPAGSVDLRLAGGNALIDKLVATGIVPAEQLMGIRMMLGLFAVPAGDDVMTSKIEMREDGGVYANGQRLR